MRCKVQRMNLEFSRVVVNRKKLEAALNTLQVIQAYQVGHIVWWGVIGSLVDSPMKCDNWLVPLNHNSLTENLSGSQTRMMLVADDPQA